MAEIDNQKPEQTSKPKPDDSTAHALTVFAQSLAYTAIEAPARGGAQLIDHTLGTKLEEGVQTKLANAGIQQPEAAAYGTKAWTAEQFGNGIGIVVPMWLARKAMVGKAEQALVKTASVEGSFAACLKTSLADSALREAKLSARTGFLYGAVLTPTDDQNSSGNILVDRLKQGFNSGVTFGAMGYSSSFTSGLLGHAAASLESTALSSVFKSSLQTALHSSLIHGAISGVPGGAIQAQLGAMESGKPFASLQDIKESVISMTMVGGTMGSVGLFRETSANRSTKTINEVKTSLSDNLAALRADSAAHSFSPASIVDSLPKEFRVIPSEGFNSPHSFDIDWKPIEKAWASEEVEKYKTTETRSITFAPEGRESRIGQENWNNFSNWGVEQRQISVDVYRFPGVTAEIVVPSEYARKLDQVRLQRLNPPAYDPESMHLLGMAANDNYRPNENRILPEEIAQVLNQLPNPDIVRTVELLDHADPWNLQKTHANNVKAEVAGEKPAPDFVALADANWSNNLNRIRFWNSATNTPGFGEGSMQWVAFHEWAHLAQGDPSFQAFKQAAGAEKDGFFHRAYAREDDDENWAVHFGERFLSPRGAHFAELPENAPARTMVYAKALRNMLEQRKDNPTPKHEEFLARAQAAEDIAARGLQEGILADIASGDEVALNQKLYFLSVAASDAKSPDITAKVLRPIDDQLLPHLETRDKNDGYANATIAHQTAYQLAENYVPEKMPTFVERWRNCKNFAIQEALFNVLPEAGQHFILDNLANVPAANTRHILSYMIENSDGSKRDLFQQTLETASHNFEKQGIALYRSGEPVPFDYAQWLQNSSNPEARLAALKNRTSLVTISGFTDLTGKLESAGLRKMIVDDAMAYVAPRVKEEAWQHTLNQLPQDEQVKLFRELAEKHDPAYQKIADKIEKMNATEFGAASEQIRTDSLKILLKRENTQEFITANPLLIKDAVGFATITESLNSKQIADLLKKSNIYEPELEVPEIVKNVIARFDANGQLDILAAISPSVDSLTRINALSELAQSGDPTVSTRAEKLICDVAEAQLKSLKAKGGEPGGIIMTDGVPKTIGILDTMAFDSYTALEEALLNADDARARLIYLNAPALDSKNKIKYEDAIEASAGLSKPQMLKFLGSGIIRRLQTNRRAQFLQDTYPDLM